MNKQETEAQAQAHAALAELVETLHRYKQDCVAANLLIGDAIRYFKRVQLDAKQGQSISLKDCQSIADGLHHNLSRLPIFSDRV